MPSPSEDKRAIESEQSRQRLIDEEKKRQIQLEQNLIKLQNQKV
jgi:hypothetical protein